MSRRLFPAGVLTAGVALVACFELSGPRSGLSAISPISVGWPSVVVGDALRDSTGDTAALHVDAFDGDGAPLADAEVRFIALDTGLTVRPDGVVIGINLRQTPARVVAQVLHGDEILQTPEINIDVVPRPDSVAPSNDTTFREDTVPLTDPAPITSDPLTVTVLSKGVGTAAAVAVKSWIVRYEIIAEPAGVDGQRTALFSGAGKARVSLDTTDASGVASRTIVLQRALLAPGTGRQNVEVRATIRDAGNNGASKSITFILPFLRP
jgi:hypothetical protein